jgi:H+-transporting ATPase
MVGIVIDGCTRNKTDDLLDILEEDIEGYAVRGFRSIAVAYEELDGDDHTLKGNGFELIGILPLLDPPREDTKQAVDDALNLGVKVKIVTSGCLATAKETGRRIGLGDHMYPCRVPRDGPPIDGKYASFDEMILDADGFSGAFPEHKYDIVMRLRGLDYL